MHHSGLGSCGLEAQWGGSATATVLFFPKGVIIRCPCHKVVRIAGWERARRNMAGIKFKVLGDRLNQKHDQIGPSDSGQTTPEQLLRSEFHSHKR